MVPEAAFHMAKKRDVSGFKLINVSIGAAILVSETEEGIEISISVCAKSKD